MKIKIDDKKIVYLVTLIFTKEGIANKMEINTTINKTAKDSLTAMENAVIDLQKKYMKVNVIAQSVHDLTPSIFQEDLKPKLTKIK